MCLAIPMELVEKEGIDAVAEIDGVRRRVSLMLLPDVELGEYVLVHAGYAIGKVDAEEARITLELMRQVLDLQEAP